METIKLGTKNEATNVGKEISTEEDEIHSKRAGDPIEKSIISALSQHSSGSHDLPVHQVDEDHYVFRKGSTEVHVQTYAASSANEIMDNEKDDQEIAKAVKLLSILIGMLLIIISTVIKMSAAISDRITRRVENQYMLVIYVVGFAWTTYYNFKGTCRSNHQLKFSKSNQSSNRWLKGVVVLFGLAIVIKNGLEIISDFMIDLSQCSYKRVEVTMLFFQTLLVLSQVGYLFKFSKVYIRNSNVGSRTGLMTIIAINISTWIASVIDEALIALAEEEEDHSADNITSTESTISTHNSTVAATTNDYNYIASAAGETSYDVESCVCSTPFCTAVKTAETFLFPFLIEFSLVASTLLYVTWENVGKKPPPCERVIKPSYKFYKRYAGSSLGCLAFFLMVVFLILIGTTASGLPESEKNYFTELSQLILYDSFLIGFETLMLLATLIGFYLFRRIRRPLEKASMLDQILLVVCIVGPLVANMFSMIAIIVGPENMIGAWILTLLSPVIEVLQCLSQLVFIVYGLKREPPTSADAKETAAQLTYGIHEHISRSSDDEKVAFDNKSYLKTRRDSVTSAVSKLANVRPNCSLDVKAQSYHDISQDEPQASKEKNIILRSSSSPKAISNQPKTVVVQAKGDIESCDHESNKSETDEPMEHPSSVIVGEFGKKDKILKIVSETKVARPDRLRFWLRDVIMFLLISNACLWIFFSLSETAFVIYQFESIFYGESAWTTITMICRPLNIFFRMHSAGCLFEMWSFA